MNMNKALQKLYKAISKEDNHKVNISKLLVDIHYALTGKVPTNKNNHAKIISELADNWSDGGGGGGSSDFSTAEVTVEGSRYYTGFILPHITEAVAIFPAMIDASSSVTDGTYTVPLYKGELDVAVEGLEDGKTISTTGDIEADGTILFITGNGTITISEGEHND